MSSGKILYLNRLKALSCIAVVVLHTFYAADAFAMTTGQHMLALSVRNLMAWAVPCFVMSSGALLLDPARKTDMGKIYRKYIPRMIIDLVVFSLLFSLFDGIFVEKSVTAGTFVRGVQNVYMGTGWKHMWYIYMMIAVYVMLPVYKIVTRAAQKNELRYILILYAVGTSLLPLIEAGLEVKLPFYIFVYSIYPLYLFTGYVLHRYGGFRKRASTVFLAVFAVATVIMTYVGLQSEQQVINDYLGNYSSPVIILGSLGAFLLFRNSSPEPCFIDKAAASISKCSFGIYLVHMAVLKFMLVVMQINPFEQLGFLMLILLTIINFGISYLLTVGFEAIKARLRRKSS